VRETILRLMVSERFRLDEVWSDVTLPHIKGVPVTKVKAFTSRNGRITKCLWAARWNRAGARSNTGMDDRTREANSETFPVSTIGTLNGEPTRTSPTGRNDRAAL
jgi:hypothetical protein